MWAGGSCVDRCTGFLTLSTTNSASFESCRDGRWDLTRRGLQTPVTITTAGTPGLTKAVDFVWPKSLRLRCWLHKLQTLMPKGLPGLGGR